MATAIVGILAALDSKLCAFCVSVGACACFWMCDLLCEMWLWCWLAGNDAAGEMFHTEEAGRSATAQRAGRGYGFSPRCCQNCYAGARSGSHSFLEAVILPPPLAAFAFFPSLPHYFPHVSPSEDVYITKQHSKLLPAEQGHKQISPSTSTI